MTADGESRSAPASGRWLRVGRVGGIRILVDPLLPVFLLAVGAGVYRAGLGLAALALVGVFVFVLLHEAGHAFAARRRGLAVRGIYLHLTSITWVEAGTPADAWRVALGGPLANLLLAGLLLLAKRLAGPLPSFELDAWLADPLAFAVVANLAIGSLNLLPVLPADGGRALHALLHGVTTPARARAVVAGLGYATAATCAVWALHLHRWPVSAYVATVGAFIATGTYQGLRRRPRYST